MLAYRGHRAGGLKRRRDQRIFAKLYRETLSGFGRRCFVLAYRRANPNSGMNWMVGEGKIFHAVLPAALRR